MQLTWLRSEGFSSWHCALGEMTSLYTSPAHPGEKLTAREVSQRGDRVNLPPRRLRKTDAEIAVWNADGTIAFHQRFGYDPFVDAL